MIDEATLDALEALVADSDGPWKLVPSEKTTTETIILHDSHGVAIADLYTYGEPCPCDRLIALAPTAIADLVAEVRRLRKRLEPPKITRQVFNCIRCGAKDCGSTYGGYCTSCDDAVAAGAPDKLRVPLAGEGREG